MEQPKFIIGIDEAGRGPLAGPVYVGLVLAPADFNFGIFPNLTDSKQMTEKQRLEVFNLLSDFDNSSIQTVASYTKVATIDKHGITSAIRQAINRGLRRLNANAGNTHIYLDGSLSAPDDFSQETIIGGDKLIPAISLASVVAKVSRDRYMERAGKNYPQYGFAQHKGYGTKSHRSAIRQHGASPLHRRTFLTNIL